MKIAALLFAVRRPAFMWHSVVTMFRHGLGRWFVFRDRPDWFVEEVAGLLESIGEDEKPSKDVVAYVHEARAEFDARQRQRTLNK